MPNIILFIITIAVVVTAEINQKGCVFNAEVFKTDCMVQHVKSRNGPAKQEKS